MSTLTKQSYNKAETTAHVYRYIAVPRDETGSKKEPIFQNISATKHLRTTTFRYSAILK